MEELAGVTEPLFLFAVEGKKERLMELTERKAKLYQAIMKHILLHRDRRHSSSEAWKPIEKNRMTRWL